jgi:hypothetical protein
MLYPKLTDAVSDTVTRDDLAERMGFVLSRRLASGLSKPDWVKGLRLTASRTDGDAYMPWYTVEVALLDPEV